MVRWVILGTLNGVTQKWSVEAPDEHSARRIAESKGILVVSITADDKMVKMPKSAPVLAPQRVTAVPAIERCGNCDSVIGRMETPHVWHQTVICGTCYSKLASPIRHESAPAPAAQPQIIMMPAPAATPPPAMHVSSNPVVYVSTTNVNKNNARAGRGCFGTLFYLIGSAIQAIVIIILLILVAIFIYSHYYAQ